MNWLNKHLSFRADLFVTLLNGLVVIGGIFILNGLIARIHGLEVLGEFLLIKRILSAVIGILLIGMNIGLPNYLSKKFNKTYGDSSFILLIVITIPLTIIFITGIIWLNVTGFSSDYFWIYILFSLSISVQSITYGLFRGHMNMIGANVVQLLGSAIIPILVFTFVKDLYIGLLWIGSSVLSIMMIGFVVRNNGIDILNVDYKKIKEIFKYGYVRIPSFVSQFILLAGVSIFLAQTESFENVAYFNSSLSLVRLSLIFVNPIGMVLLPRISNRLANSEKNDITLTLNIFFKAGVVFSVITSMICYLYTAFILKYWLGEASDTGITILRITIWALPFYTLSGLTRSPIDAASKRGLNSLIYGFAAMSMIIIIFLGKLYGLDTLSTALYSFLISHFIAGIISAYFIKKLYNYWLWDYKLIRDIIVCVIMMSTLKLIISFSKLTILLELGITIVIYFTIGLIFIKYAKTGWIAELKRKLIV